MWTLKKEQNKWINKKETFIDKKNKMMVDRWEGVRRLGKKVDGIKK